MRPLELRLRALLESARHATTDHDAYTVLRDGLTREVGALVAARGPTEPPPERVFTMLPPPDAPDTFDLRGWFPAGEPGGL